MMTTTSHDVAIIGAGPAGSSAAHRLAEEGAKVVLFEKATFPRYKTCGGGLTPGSVRLLSCDIRDIVERKCIAAEVHLHDADLHFVTRRDTPIVTMTMRDRLDERLLRAALRRGAEVRMATEVTDIVCRPEGVRLIASGKSLSARFVIAAEGALSPTVRILDRGGRAWVMPALEAEIPAGRADLERSAQTARFDFGLISDGYAWVFPKDRHLSIGCLSVRRGRTELHAALARYVKLLGIEEPHTMERHGFVIPCRPRKRIVLNGRVLLVGDAAGFVDPLTGEGIRFALLSGRLAAEAILEGKYEAPAVERAYRRLISDRILPEIGAARLLARVTYHHPTLRTALFRRLGGEICEALTDVVMGTRTYRELLRDPSPYWKLLRQFLTYPIK